MVSESCIVNCCVAGHTEMSFLIRKGIPAKMSTSNSSTTRASRTSFLLERERQMCTWPMTASGVVPSAFRACYDVFSMVRPSDRVSEALIMLVSVPVSRVNLTGCCL